MGTARSATLLAAGGHTNRTDDVAPHIDPQARHVQRNDMTATLSTAPGSEALSDRLQTLRRERDEALAEVAPNGTGDDADRATNVDGHVRLEMLERRIADVEYQLAQNRSDGPNDGTVAVGSVVTVDFGDGREKYLFGSVDYAGAGLDVITPGSPLGRALLGAKTGSAISYEPRAHVRLTAKVVAVD
jgi:transcription elongation factor GreA